MKNQSNARRRLPTQPSRGRSAVETLETRSLLATWSGYAELIGQDKAASQFSTLTGTGQTVAVIDTGIDYNNASLGGGFGAGHKVIGGYDFYNNDSDPIDTDGHGTETAGMIAADRFTQNGITYQGIAPDAHLVALRVGTGTDITDARIEKALQWVITNYKTFGITVVNLSLGSGAYSTTTTANSQLADEFASLAKLNIFITAASGNNGTSEGGTVSYPAADPNVFAVGSISASDQISSFTQRGNQVLDLLAPGEQVTTTKLGGGYSTVDGTSFSSPLVAGVVALLRQAASSLNVKDLASVLRTSSTTQYDGDGDTGQTTKEVYARLNLVAAITLASSLNSDGDLDYILGGKNSTFDSAYDTSGILHLAYYDPARARLMYATQKADGTWTTPVVVDNSGDRVGSQLSLAIDQTGKAAVAYYNATQGDLKYAWFTGTKWSNTTLDSNKTVGLNPSLVFDDAGDPRISYYKKNGGDLKLDSYDRTTGLWTRSVLDSTGDVGLDSSIAYLKNSSGYYTLAVAYSDTTTGDLKYWRYGDDPVNGGTYTATADSLNGVSNIDLKLVPGNNGGARIAYQDTTNADVKVAYRSTTWSSVVVNSSGSSGQSVQSYVDSDNVFHVVYYSKTKAATYDSTIVASLTTLSGQTGLTATLGTTTRIGTLGQIASVAAVGDVVTLVGLSKSGKSISASDLT